MSEPGKSSAFTQETAAQLIMVDDRHLRRLIKDGWIPKKLTIPGVVQGYIKWLKDIAERNQQNTARAETQKIRNEQAKLQLKVQDGQYIETRIAMAAFSDVIGSLRADLEIIPSRVGGRDAALRKIVEDLIGRALNSAADKCEEAEAALSPVGGNSKAAAHTLARRLGASESKIPFKRGRPRKRQPAMH